MKRLKDHEKATLMLFLATEGWPLWAQDGPGQELVLARLTGWSLERAKAALVRAVHAGYADNPAILARP